MAPATPKYGRIFNVRLLRPELKNLFTQDSATEVLNLLSRGSRVTRYRRTWLIGKTDFAERVLTGRIGYIGEGTLTEVWDDELNDFRDEVSATGLTTTFGINVDTLRGLVQERKPLIAIEGAVGALEDLLSAGARGRPERWTIENVQGTRELSEWLRTVTRVTSIRLTVKAPNPHYENEPDLEALMEGFEAEVVRMEIESDTGVNTGSKFLADTQRHIDRGYGDARYSGIRIDGSGEHHTSYSTRVGVEELNDEVPVGSNGEVDPEELRRRLRPASPLTVDELQQRLANEVSDEQTESNDGGSSI